MRVLVSRQAEEQGDGAALGAALAGSVGQVVFLAAAGVKNLARPLSQAEIHSLRKALSGVGPGKDLQAREEEEGAVGLVCLGRRTAEHPLPGVAAVADHVNLTWRSPLRGGNDERLGPRFPVVAGLYEPKLVTDRVGGRPAEVAVAQVARIDGLTDFEREIVRALDIPAVSEELVPVALLAAHLGYRVAAALILE